MVGLWVKDRFGIRAFAGKRLKGEIKLLDIPNTLPPEPIAAETFYIAGNDDDIGKCGLAFVWSCGCQPDQRCFHAIDDPRPLTMISTGV